MWIKVELFKINSQIRDFDVITDLIRKNNPENGNGNKMDLTKFENRRASKLKEAKVVAVGLRKLSVPNVDKGSISAGKLTKRYNKLISNFGSRIQLNLPLVIADADKVNELHEMRKDCKKLRYLLELVPHGKSSDKNMSKLEEELQNMQDLLGAIHDCDAAVAHLKRQTKRQRRNDIIEHIVQERKGDMKTYSSIANRISQIISITPCCLASHDVLINSYPKKLDTHALKGI